ncbi:N-acyl homoserine lactonase family protein [Dictyobacter aurantiacus]|uniref:N-acyl homoserine lactonase family protein n=1 Tax=Dictyobacter aurantiacus TaxID=1936993 RepID=A0A401ZK73_9CHLR|nr:N-acyl homoserine lactonase family protein [Dictyobacter aurantiacus]GCE07230.1 N-acyl homoserine lactonase family protein [Dictyobacter aurantiacus]
MRIHALQTGTVAIKEGQRQGKGHGVLRQLNMFIDKTWTEPLPIYAWVIEHPEGIIVVDTGETSRTSEPGYFPRWHPYYRSGVREWVRPEQEVGPQLRALGIAPSDVRWLVLTHLHTDHAGGLHHFPQSEILVSRTEYRLASSLTGRLLGYLPDRWPDWFAPRLLDFAPQPYGPFPDSYTLTGAGDVVLVATPGHTPGHLSVMVQDGPVQILLAGDTSYNQQLLLDGIVDGVSGNETVARQTIQRIQQQLRDTPTVYLPSHDAGSARRLEQRATVTFAP